MNIPFELTPLGDGDGYHLFIQTTLNDVPCRLLIDTGASKSILSNDFAQQIGKHELIEQDKQTSSINDNQIKTSIIQFHLIDFNNHSLVDWTFGLLDLNVVNETYKSVGVLPIDGILGSDILHHFKASIDFQTDSLTFQ